VIQAILAFLVYHDQEKNPCIAILEM
jgi:hypothetical protein